MIFPSEITNYELPVTGSELWVMSYELWARTDGHFPDRQWDKGRQALKHSMLVAQLLKSGHVKRVWGVARFRAAGWNGIRVQIDKLLSIGYRQVSKKDSIHHTEDCCIGANAQSQRQHGNGGEAGIFSQLAQTVLKILKQCAHDFPF
jgi:hypothetical protein